ncbi:MAG TPA: molybdate ABC transporter permease subunit [Rhizobiales bacterium]|jgi:molybdate transport system permease protein|nr:molybdate ABC transporter permease subunit [Hyphomicrobiales bacterium]
MAAQRTPIPPPCGEVGALCAPGGGAKSHVFVLAIKRRKALPLRVGPADGKKPVVLTLSPEELTAIKLSLRVATWATIVSLPFGVLVAMLLARGRFYGRSLLNALVLLPLVLPPVVTGYVLLLLFGRQGPLGRWFAETLGIVFAFRWTGAALACAVMGFPLMVRAIQLSAAAVDRKLEQAASTLGASPPLVFLTVTLPLMAPGIIAGAILGFARAMGEFGATITFVSNIPGQTQTLPTLIYTFTQVPGGDAGALRLTLISLAISLTAILASEWLAREVGRRVRAD